MRWRAAVAAGAAGAAALAGPLDAQTDPSGRYRTWTTEHFRIHARAELADAARVLARESERAWSLLAGELVPPSGRTDVVLFDNVDFSNGFATIFPSKRITLFLATPAGDVSLGHFDDWLRLVITHELVHVFHLDRTRGVWRGLRAVLGRVPGVFPNAYQPSWVSEGIATYYESRYTRAGRVRGGFHGQLLASRAGGGWPDPNDATFVSPAWPTGFRPYAWGSRFFTHQADLYGDSVVPRFVEATSGQLWPLRVSVPLRQAGGTALEPGWAALEEAWSGRRGPQGRVLVRGLRTEPRARVSPEGDRVAYVHDDGRATIHLAFLDPSTGRTRRGPLTSGDAELAWVDGTLYAAQLEFPSPVEILSDLYELDGDRWARRTHRARITTVFPLGRDAVGVARTVARGHALAVWHVRDARLEPLPAPPADDWGRAAVSPDGRWIAAARHREGRWDLVLWPPGRPEAAVEVTADQALDADPAWTPDGGTVLFTSERFGLPQVMGYRVADGRLFRYTEEPFGARQPAMTADGRLLYTTLLEDGFAVAALDAPQPLSGGAVAAVPLPFEPAPPVAVRETGYRPWAALRPHYWIPLVRDEGPPGVFLGALTTGSDPVGRVGYSATVFLAPASGRMLGVLGLQYAHWRRFTVDLSASQDWDFAGFVRDSVAGDFPVDTRERFATGGVTWRWRRWRRSAFARLGIEWEDDVFVANDAAAPDVSRFDFTRWGPVLSGGWSRAERPALAISPEDGVAVSGLVRVREEIGGTETSGELRAAAAGYLGLDLPGFAHWVLAANVRAGHRTGRGTFELGAESGSLFEVAPGIVLGNREAFPLRAYPENAERFTWVATGALELRIPLFLVAEGLWKLPLGLDRVSLALFGETGMGSGAEGVLRFPGVGGELLLDLALGNEIPLRVRTGLAVPLRDGLGATAGDPRGYVAFGPAF